MGKCLFWVDLEMTGLNEKTDFILEIAVVITDFYLNSLDRYHRVVYQPPEILACMGDWCKRNHQASGLIAEVAHGMPLPDVEQELFIFTKKHFRPEERIILAGNSVSSDKKFIEAQMPLFAKRLHYRIIDVSSYKEIFRERYGIGFIKENRHRATLDIQESIRELDYYLSFIKLA